MNSADRKFENKLCKVGVLRLFLCSPIHFKCSFSLYLFGIFCLSLLTLLALPSVVSSFRLFCRIWSISLCRNEAVDIAGQ